MVIDKISTIVYYLLYLLYLLTMLTIFYIFPSIVYYLNRGEENIWFSLLIILKSTSASYSTRYICLVLRHDDRFRVDCMWNATENISFHRNEAVSLFPNFKNSEEVSFIVFGVKTSSNAVAKVNKGQTHLSARFEHQNITYLRTRSHNNYMSSAFRRRTEERLLFSHQIRHFSGRWFDRRSRVTSCSVSQKKKVEEKTSK